jgi:hypothetical protein
MTETRPMDKGHVPESFGVFKPVGHVVLGFEHEADQRSARDALRAAGFAADDIVAYGAEEMRAPLDAQLDKASGAAGFGYEVVLAQHHRELAERGHTWLVVHAPSEERSAAVARIAREHHAALADRYGTLVVEQMLRPTT